MTTTESSKPPIMERAEGAYASLPSQASAPSEQADDGGQRSHEYGAQTDAAGHGDGFLQRPALRSKGVREKSTIRMLFETTMPTIITTPISDMTFSVVPVR